MNSGDIVNDVRPVCLSDTQTTEQERPEVLFGIRPTLKTMNRTVKRMIVAVNDTALGDGCAEIDYSARSEADNPTIVQQCKERWKRNANRRSSESH